MSHSLIQIILYGLVAVLGGCTTFMLSNYTQLSKVQASALPTFIFSLAIYLYTSGLSCFYDYTLLPSVFFGASFIGMTSKKVSSLFDILLASLFFVLLSSLSENLFQNFGGKLGLMACISVVVSLGFRWTRRVIFSFWKIK